LNADLSVKDAMQVLSKWNITGAPVEQGGRFLGFVDVLDIAGWAIHQWKYLQQDHFRVTGTGVQVPPSDAFFDSPVSTIVNFSRCDESVIVDENTNLLDIMEILSGVRFNNIVRTHRVALTGADGKLIDVLTQSDIISFARDYIKILPITANQPLKTLGIIHPVVCVKLHSHFHDTLEILHHNRISGLALVNEHQHIVANFSASDLKGLSEDMFKYFYRSTEEFLKRGTSSPLQIPVTCTDDATLADIIPLLLQEQMHRIFVIDDVKRPIGVVTMSDIIKVLLQH